jgi:hypothetical protein
MLSMGAAKKNELDLDIMPDLGGDLVVNPLAKKDEVQLFSLKQEKTDMGRVNSLRFNVMSDVLNEQYDRAISELREFLEKPSPYPEFRNRITRYIDHSIDLIFAIKAKRNFPGINSLTRAKQQELREKFKEHFKELQGMIKKIEKVERDLEIVDVRSTIHVVRALWLAIVAVLLCAFVLEVVRGLASTGLVVVEQLFADITDWLFNLIGY